MARPTKEGVDYFPVDVDFDTKMDLFIAETGAAGFGVLMGLWQMIYKDRGYFIEYSEDLLLMLRRQLMVDVGQAREFIEIAVRRNIFNKDIFEQHQVLTSSGIQRRYLLAAAKRTRVSIDRNFLLTDVSSCKNVELTGFLPEETTQSKVKESKVNTVSNDTVCPEPENGTPDHPPPSEPVDQLVTEIPTNKFKTEGETFAVRMSHVRSFEEAYPGLDVVGWLRRIKSHNVNKDTGRKTKRGVLKHIDTWLAKEFNRGNLSPNGAPNDTENGTGIRTDANRRAGGRTSGGDIIGTNDKQWAATG